MRPPDEVLIFELDGARYGLPAHCVRQIVRAVLPTPLPGLGHGAALEGLIDLHGEVVPLFDVRARFGLPARQLRPGDQLVVLELRSRTVALRADAVLGLESIDETLRAEVAGLTGPFPHLAGVLRLGDGLVLLQDLEQFLTRTEELALDAALANRPERLP